MIDMESMISDTLDLWSLIHLFGYAVIASTIAAIWYPKWWVHLVYGLSLSFVWETAEHFLSRIYTDAWSNYIEHWSNSWVTDPICNMLGVLFGVAVVGLYRR